MRPSVADLILCNISYQLIVRVLKLYYQKYCRSIAVRRNLIGVSNPDTRSSSLKCRTFVADFLSGVFSKIYTQLFLRWSLDILTYCLSKKEAILEPKSSPL